MTKPLRLLFILFGAGLLAGLLLAQPPQQPPASTPQPPPSNSLAPTLTLDEKISLSTDDIRRQDILEKLQKEFNEAIKPINEHQEATKQVIEKEHPGFHLQATPQGWTLVKDEPKKAAGEEKKPAEPAKK